MEILQKALLRPQLALRIHPHPHQTEESSPLDHTSIRLHRALIPIPIAIVIAPIAPITQPQQLPRHKQLPYPTSSAEPIMPTATTPAPNHRQDELPSTPVPSTPGLPPLAPTKAPSASACNPAPFVLLSRDPVPARPDTNCPVPPAPITSWSIFQRIKQLPLLPFNSRRSRALWHQITSYPHIASTVRKQLLVPQMPSIVVLSVLHGNLSLHMRFSGGWGEGGKRSVGLFITMFGRQPSLTILCI
ncbi:hypothetical protein CCMA1212_001752 [Trichoderma ghanense]|uniref:Uncharacterized protein n=1 Tax=Trichoderma ghanense TaxID=65468 RepID=A0ABY2HD53_9HYPO